MLTENKFSKYLLYAIGEIVLVVIGILIALSINNWNEENKRNSLKSTYIKSLKSDLENDIIFLNSEIESLQNDLSKSESFSTRLSSSKATIDTLVKIVRFEFDPRSGGPNQLNRNTYNALVATGNINLFGQELTKKLHEHNASQSNTLATIRLNHQIYVDRIEKYAGNIPFNTKFNAINGVLMESFWDSINENNLKYDFNAVLSSRIRMLDWIVSFKKKLLKQTQELIEQIKTLENSE
jgi:hypothetical protein